MTNKIFVEGEYQIDCSSAKFASNKMRDYYQDESLARYGLNDVDWVIEDDNYIYLVEYKNSNIENGIEMDIEGKIDSLSRKFHHSLLYLFAIGTTKQLKCISILENRKDDSAARTRVRNELIKKLPIRIKRIIPQEEKIIKDVIVFSIDEWNRHEIYGKYPISKV